MLNQFARLTTRVKEAQAEKKALQDQLDQLQFAQEQVMLAPNGQAIPFHSGHAFFHLSDTEATELVDSKISKVEGKIRDLDSTVAGWADKLSTFKATLYAKFGKNQINLDE